MRSIPTHPDHRADRGVYRSAELAAGRARLSRIAWFVDDLTLDDPATLGNGAILGNRAGDETHRGVQRCGAQHALPDGLSDWREQQQQAQDV
ncbi:MAG: hypothetical protein ACRDSH_20665, partial [Pseudonocardiaceae bacterium]